VIRAGRRVLDKAAIAVAAGFGSLRSAQRADLFKQPGMPASVTSGSKNQLFDEQQIHAWLKGDPIPPLPDEDHPDDLLDEVECAELWGVKPRTWYRYYRLDEERTEGQRRLLPPLAEGEDVPEGMLFWRRGAVESHQRPGPGAGAGRPSGARDTRPRARRSERNARKEAVQLMLQEAEPGEPVTPRQVADELDIPMRLAQSLLKELKTT
jgi:hypothetical protein